MLKQKQKRNNTNVFNKNLSYNSNNVTKSNYDDDLNVPDDIFEQKGGDDHTMWNEKSKIVDKLKSKIEEKAFKNLDEKCRTNSQNYNNTELNTQDSGSTNNVGNQNKKLFDNDEIKAEEQLEYEKSHEEHFIDERSNFEQNRQTRLEQAKAQLNKLKLEYISNQNISPFQFETKETKNVLNWKQILKQEFKKEEQIWSQRRSVAENGYAYRIEDYEIYEDSLTEVLIDVSGSVNLQLISAFLQEIRQISKNSKLKVGCFNNEFHGFTEIKTVKDLRTAIVKYGGGTNFNEATSNFSKSKNVNKIVFTDGYGDYDGYDKDIVWTMYQNTRFKPSCGKVIFIEPKQIILSNLYTNNKFQIEK